MASYAFAKSSENSQALSLRIEAGMTAIDHNGLPEVPFGGIKHSGYGLEGGSEAIEPYLLTRYVSSEPHPEIRQQLT